MKKRTRKLALNRETLRNMNAGKLTRIVGGTTTPTLQLECQDIEDWENTVTDTIESGPALCGGTMSLWGYC